jgi:hypothetical protein
MTTQNHLTTRKDLESQLEAVGWGLFFLMSGAVLLVPALPDGSWLIGLGAIFLGLSAVRFTTGLPVSALAVIVGVCALAAGAGAVAGLAVPGFALLLVLCGLALIAGQLVRRSRDS